MHYRLTNKEKQKFKNFKIEKNHSLVSTKQAAERYEICHINL